MIADKEEIIYSLKKYITELENTIKCSIENKRAEQNEIYACLGTVILWIGICLDRIKTLESNEDEYIIAFRGAYNAQKHSINLITLNYYQKGGMAFPTRFSLNISAPNYFFKELKEDVIENKHQIELYNKYLCRKPIIAEVKKIERIIISKL